MYIDFWSDRAWETLVQSVITEYQICKIYCFRYIVHNSIKLLILNFNTITKLYILNLLISKLVLFFMTKHILLKLDNNKISVLKYHFLSTRFVDGTKFFPLTLIRGV